MRKLIYNKYLITNLIVGSIILKSFFFFAYSSGITGKTKKNGQGCTCHGNDPTSTVNVSISGPQILSPGAKGTYSLTITGGPLVRAGTNIAVSSGTLNVVPGSGLQKIGDELTHTSPKAPQAGVVSFDFELTAPNTPGVVTLYANGNSVNFNGSSGGDAWNYATNFTINVTTTSVEKENLHLGNFELYQNYPNPFNPSTVFSYKLIKDGFVTLKIYDLFSKEVATLVNEHQREGKYEIVFEPNKYNLASGTYFYVMDVNGIKDSRKFIYLK